MHHIHDGRGIKVEFKLYRRDYDANSGDIEYIVIQNNGGTMMLRQCLQTVPHTCTASLAFGLIGCIRQLVTPL